MTTSDQDRKASAGASAPLSLSQRGVRRLAAAAGVIALALGVLTLIPAALGAVGWGWPLSGLLLALAAVVFLRVSTVREQRARINAAFAEAMNAERAQLARVGDLQDDPRVIEERARRRRQAAEVFDAARLAAAQTEGADAERAGSQEASPQQESAAAQANPAADQAGEAAESEPRAEQPSAEAPAVQRTSTDAAREAVAPGPQWEPVAVPRPTYLDAPEAGRALPAPVQPEESSTAVPSKLDLDEVLRRRRA